MNALDRDWMSLALEAAAEGSSRVFPNPRVGCVVVNQKGKLLGQGAHLQVGEAHAEVNAIAQCKDEDLEGATLYVTLEPCSHRGKTPPCAELIIKKKIARVVYGMSDPGPGKGGVEVLKGAGVEVDGPMMDMPGLVEILEPFCKNMLKQEAYFIQKWAMTLDGKIACANGESKWISNEDSRKRVHKLRGACDGILVGAGTVMADQPKLDVRYEIDAPSPRPIVWDPDGKTRECKTWWEAMASRMPIVLSNHTKGWVEGVLALKCKKVQELGKLLFLNGVHCVLVEGGSGVHGLINDAQVGDALMVFVASKWVGGAQAPSPMGGEGVSKMSEAKTLIRQQLSFLKGDLLFEGMVQVHHPEAMREWGN